MTAVFVHGVPETAAVWEPLAAHLGRGDVELLDMPGFGSPLPEGFEPTMHAYADWLAGELERFDDIDLVTHDWGALLALRVLADRPGNVRSWATDVGDLSADFQWHATAKTWQTPGEGEALVEGFVGASAQDRAALLTATGVPESGARTMAEAIDETMGAAILTLYRSATDIGNEWGPGIDRIEGPGLLIASGQDPFRSTSRARRLAERTGAEIVELPEAGHWWMLEQPEQAAGILRDFWSRAS